MNFFICWLINKLVFMVILNDETLLDLLALLNIATVSHYSVSAIRCLFPGPLQKCCNPMVTPKSMQRGHLPRKPYTCLAKPTTPKLGVQQLLKMTAQRPPRCWKRPVKTNISKISFQWSFAFRSTST